MRLDLLLEGQASYVQGMVSFTGVEEWTLERALLGSRPQVLDSVALEWGEEDPIPLHQESGSRIRPAEGMLRLSAAYHQTDFRSLSRIHGTLIFQPIDGLYLPPIDIDVS